jgi:hypothetical protein
MLGTKEQKNKRTNTEFNVCGGFVPLFVGSFVVPLTSPVAVLLTDWLHQRFPTQSTLPDSPDAQPPGSYP